MRSMKVGPLEIALVVDDAAVRGAAAEALGAEGYGVRAFASGAEALAALGSGTAPHLIVLGLERRQAQRFREAQRRDLSLSAIPLVSLGAGVDAEALLPRPLDPMRLVATAHALTQSPSLPPPSDRLGELAERLRSMAARYPELAARTRELAARAGCLPEVEPPLAEAKRGAERYRLLAQQLERFGRGIEQPAEVDLRRLLDQVLELCGDEIKYRASLIRRIDKTPPVRADERQLAHVFFNLVINAVQAIPDGKPAQNRIEVAAATSPGGWAIVEIRDTGNGIPKDVLPRIFDPFFSTKPVDGSGVGLAICQSTVNDLGGSITVHSEVGRGTTFRVSLPPAERARG
jgi:signal transduction histidine kinase